jgi:hypothetical protein
MLGELYFNIDREADIKNLQWKARLDRSLTRIANRPANVLNQTEGGLFKKSVGDQGHFFYE